MTVYIHFMPNTTLEDIDRIHSMSSMMDKVAKMAYLQGERKKLEDMAYQLGRSYRIKGYFTSQEKECANHILEMMNEVQSEGQRLNSEFSNEWWNEWRKDVLRLL